MFLIPSESFYQWWLGIPNRQIIIVDLLVCGQCYFLLKSFYLSFNFVRSFSSLKFGNLLGHVIELKFGQTDFPRHLVHINIHTHTHTHKDTHKHKRMDTHIQTLMCKHMQKSFTYNHNSRFSNIPLLDKGLYLHVGEVSELNHGGLADFTYKYIRTHKNIQARTRRYLTTYR